MPNAGKGHFMSHLHLTAVESPRHAPRRPVAWSKPVDRAGEARALALSITVAAALVTAGFALRILSSGLL